VKIDRVLEGGHAKLRLTVETLDLHGHAKLTLNDVTKEELYAIIDKCAVDLVDLLRRIKDLTA
jgi:hypothetical protein